MCLQAAVVSDRPCIGEEALHSLPLALAPTGLLVVVSCVHVESGGES